MPNFQKAKKTTKAPGRPKAKRTHETILRLDYSTSKLKKTWDTRRIGDPWPVRSHALLDYFDKEAR